MKGKKSNSRDVPHIRTFQCLDLAPRQVEGENAGLVLNLMDTGAFVDESDARGGAAAEIGRGHAEGNPVF
jgi:hypothetical protein